MSSDEDAAKRLLIEQGRKKVDTNPNLISISVRRIKKEEEWTSSTTSHSTSSGERKIFSISIIIL